MNTQYSKRIMTTIESEALNMMMSEFDYKLPSNGRAHCKVHGSDLRRTIAYVIAGVTIHRTDVKQTYQKWTDDCKDTGDMWALSVTLTSFRKVWQRAEELLHHRLSEIDNAPWYVMNYKDRKGNPQQIIIDMSSDQEARECYQWNLRWNDFKAVSMYRAKWNGKSYKQTERVSLKGYTI